MTTVNHDLRSNDGRTIYHLPEIDGATGQGNLAIPNIFDESATALYPIGTRFVSGDRTFHYCHFTTAITKTNAAKLSYSGRDATYGQPASYDTAQAAGVGTLANPLKVDGTSVGLPVKNFYAGAYIIPWVTATLGNPTMRIVKSTASAADSLNAVQTVELVLEQPTPVAIAANTSCDTFLSRYADVREAWGGGSDMHHFVGVPMRIFTDEYYGWIQTWGPCFIVCTATELGDASYDRTAIFNNDGSIAPADEAWGKATPTSNQFAGCTLAINGAGSEWIMLMLDR